MHRYAEFLLVSRSDAVDTFSDKGCSLNCKRSSDASEAKAM